PRCSVGGQPGLLLRSRAIQGECVVGVVGYGRPVGEARPAESKLGCTASTWIAAPFLIAGARRWLAPCPSPNQLDHLHRIAADSGGDEPVSQRHGVGAGRLHSHLWWSPTAGCASG